MCDACLKVACTRKELSCILWNLFYELLPTCGGCDDQADDDLIVTGRVTGTGETATVRLTDYGFELYGGEATLRHIRETRCIKNGTSYFNQENRNLST